MVCKKALSTSFYFVIKFLCPQFLAIIENDTYGVHAALGDRYTYSKLGIQTTKPGSRIFLWHGDTFLNYVDKD